LSKSCPMITVRFVVEGEVVVAGHEAKAVKGILARQLLLNGLGALETFSWQGWRTDQDAEVSRVVAPRRKARDVVVAFDGLG